MNQTSNLNDICQTSPNEEKNKSTFLPSNYYFEKDYFGQSNKAMNSMPSQYYNFQQKSESSGAEIKNNDQKTFIQPSTLPNCQQNPFNITNNISISNFSISDNQKKEINFEPQFKVQMSSFPSEELQKKNPKKKKMQANQSNNYQGSFQNDPMRKPLIFLSHKQ